MHKKYQILFNLKPSFGYIKPVSMLYEWYLKLGFIEIRCFKRCFQEGHDWGKRICNHCGCIEE